MSKSESASEYEIQYRSTIQPRTAVRSQSRQSGNYVSGGTGGGGGVNFYPTAVNQKFKFDQKSIKIDKLQQLYFT
ncbi:hypothetical protein NECAME_12946 [Necator americanus]|uniref:Uncharacterized protein n=1 Tax=Necator americanus TaxID=51031 RepID=W2SZQ0_NECAM|nr:hypothetical protein NECAME_12946 [Necator americanus]ETN74481.1 hypothetical protein NECAME_12946 [Necator americanus]